MSKSLRHLALGATLLIGPPGESLYDHDLRMPFNVTPLMASF